MTIKSSLITILLFLLINLCSVSAVCGSEDKPITSDTTLSQSDSLKLSDSTTVSESVDSISKVIVYYFHSTQRCVTCRKIESYSQEAVETAFPNKLKDSTVEWRLVNYDEDENKHFLKDYQLFTKSLVLSRVEDGVELSWKNLDKIWQLVGDKDKFVAYVQSETKQFLNKK